MEAFANRLQKVNRHIAKWAQRQQVFCYRIYDLDIPEYPFAIDRYEDYLHVSEYQRSRRMQDELYPEWLQACLNTISTALHTPPDHIFIKQRRRIARREEQYEKVDTARKKIIVRENDLRFLVNLSDYLDTGLFLDHRPLRSRFRHEAGGKKVLNLFAYTGSFSVYAAAGGAHEITTVDLSKPYLNWAEENMALNGLAQAARHRYVNADTMDFLKQHSQRYDLVFADPPAFSNSKKLKGTWDTQRDHPALLQLILQRMNPGGTLYFSNNFRGFEPDFSRLANCHITDISLDTIPADFRNKKIHYCYRILT